VVLLLDPNRSHLKAFIYSNRGGVPPGVVPKEGTKQDGFQTDEATLHTPRPHPDLFNAVYTTWSAVSATFGKKTCRTRNW
jgi:hypothetical protein